MLLDNLLKASIVQLSELGQIMDVSNNVAYVVLKQQKMLFGRGISGLARLIAGSILLLSSGNNSVNLVLDVVQPLGNIVALVSLEGVDFVQLLLELADKVLLVVFGPWLPGRMWGVLGGLDLVGSLEAGFEVVVCNV